MTDAFVLGGVRTPVGRYGGSLSHIRTDDRPGTLSHKASSERPRPARGRGCQRG
jgi:acetyl-CoA acetyltransferase